MGMFIALQVPWGQMELTGQTPGPPPAEHDCQRAACPTLRPDAFQSHFASTQGDGSPQPAEVWPQSVPRSNTYHHGLLRRHLPTRAQRSITPLLPQEQISGFGGAIRHVPMHTFVSHHLTTLCFLLLATTVLLRLFAKGLLLLLIVQWEPEAKCVNGKGGGRRPKWSLVVHNSPLSLAILGSLSSSFHLRKPGCWPQHNIATGEREEEGLTFIYFSAIIRIMSGGKSINT